MENPKVLIASIENMQREQMKTMEEQASANLDKYKNELAANPNDPTIGPANAKVTVIEFFDYNCGYCKKMLETKQKLVANDKVRFVLKELPVLGPASQTKARLALAVNNLYKDKYESFHNEMLTARANSEEEIKEIISKLGMDYSKVKAEADSERVSKTLADNQQLAGKVGIRGTPGYVVGNKLIPGYVDYEGFKEIIAAQKSAN